MLVKPSPARYVQVSRKGNLFEPKACLFEPKAMVLYTIPCWSLGAQVIILGSFSLFPHSDKVLYLVSVHAYSTSVKSRRLLCIKTALEPYHMLMN